MTTPTPNPGPSKLARQVRWSLVAIAIIVLALLSTRPSGNTGDTGGDGCTVTVTADVLNIRSGPGTEYATVDQLSRNDVVEAEPETSGAFRKLSDGRWVASEFVQPSPGCDEPRNGSSAD